MSFPSEDRHERDLAGVQPRNPSQEMEKHDKSKLMSGVPGVPMTHPESGTFHRQHLDQANIKAGKPLQNRPIAPASGSIGGMLPGHLVSGGLPGFGTAPGHPLIPSAPLSLTSMMRVSAAQPAFSHVPAGAAAGALAGVTPRSSSALRTPTVPPSKPTVLASQTHATTGQSQGHMPATTVVSSHPSSPGSATSHLATVAVTTSMHQQASDHKQSELREVRPGMVSDMGRRGASPHCPSPVVHAAAPTHASVASGSKVIPVISSALPQNHPGQKSSLSLLQSHLLPSSVQHSGMPATAVGSSLSNSISLVPTAGVAMSAHAQPSKMLPSNTVSVMPSGMTGQGKVYTHSHHFTAPRQAAIPSSDAIMNPVDRLSKTNGSASPATVSALHTSTISTVSHLGAASLNSVVGNENRMERTHQALPVASQFPYHPGMAGFLYPDALSVHPHAAGLHAQYQQPAFGHLSSITRSQQGVSTSAAAAAAAQVAVAAAAGVNPMHIVDPSRILFQQAALGVGASGMGSLGGVDTPVTGGVMDITGATAGIYSVPLLTVPPSAGIQAQLSAQNPNATSPRPSILRKRAIESVRKPPTQLPYTEMMPTNQTEAAASPRSDSTLSAPHSTQNSPKPPSDAGSQPVEPVVTTSSLTPKDIPVVNQTMAASPVKIKRESSTEVPVSTAVHTVAVNGNISLTAANTPLVSTATTTTDAASPRKKPRKQNVVATEDKYGSHVSMGPDSPTTAEDKIAKRDEDEDLKFILLKRPKISIVGGYKINTKAAHNHFQRYTDVKVKEERKPSIQEIATQKGIVQRANGWRIQHIAGQMDELISAEQEVLKKMGEFRERIPKVKPGQKTKFQDELTMLNELLQGNIQRSQLVVEQLGDSRKSMIKVLDHRQKVLDIIQKQMNKRNPKKKN